MNAIKRNGWLAALSVAMMATSTMADVLIYTDQSAGTVHLFVLEKMVAATAQEPVTVATDTTSFEQHLASGTWKYVVVLAKYQSGSPSYAQALSTYAAQGNYTSTDKMVRMYIWHDNGTTPAPNTAVSATTAIVTWLFGGRSYISYTGSENEPITSTTFAFPDFQGITISNPSVIGIVPVNAASSTSQYYAALSALFEQEGSCKKNCEDDGKKDIQRCISRLEDRIQWCFQVHPTDLPAQAICMAQAGGSFQTCQQDASEHTAACLAACPPEEEEPSN